MPVGGKKLYLMGTVYFRQEVCCMPVRRTMKVLKTEIHPPKRGNQKNGWSTVDYKGCCLVGDLLEWVVFTLCTF
jgi:hypothetical protein